MNESKGATQLRVTKTKGVLTRMTLGEAATASKCESEECTGGVHMRRPMSKEDKRTIVGNKIVGVQR